MNKKAKRRLVVTGGIVAIAMLVIVAIAGSGGAASSLTVGDLLTGDYAGKKVQVTGSVVDGSIETDGTAVRFDITPEEGDGSESVRVVYEGALPATFGSGVVAICTGTVENPPHAQVHRDGHQVPVRYESVEGSLTVKGLIDQADTMMFEDTKVCGYIQGEVNDASADYRFVIESQGATLDGGTTGSLD
ncbi:MAG: cytochrome c maturation protein CcmE [Collinsella sp.]